MNSPYEKLRERLQVPERPIQALIGLDGFVDTILHVVDQRYDSTHYSRIETLSDYGKRVMEACGMSLNLEVVIQQEKIGGNGPIFASGLKTLGAKTTYIGAIGVEQIHPVFAELTTDRCSAIGVAEPAITDAYEFRDGKLISSKLNSLNNLTWQSVSRAISPQCFAEMLDAADVFSFNNWTMIPDMNHIWAQILETVMPNMKQHTKSRIAFFDLADPRKRTKADILTALNLIQRFAEEGFRTILGLNYKEALQVQKIITASATDESLEAILRTIEEFMGIDAVVIHKTSGAACIQNNIFTEIPTTYCDSPQIKTGCGDVFNAGFIYAQAHAWTTAECLALGNLMAGYYIRNARIATPRVLSDFCL